MVITRFLKNKYSRDWPTGTGPNGAGPNDSFADYALSLLTPASGKSKTKHGRSQLKATMLSSTATLLPCLIFIKILPLLSTEVVSCSLGLHHLDHSDNIPSCSPCFNLITTNTTVVTGDCLSNL